MGIKVTQHKYSVLILLGAVLLTVVVFCRLFLINQNPIPSGAPSGLLMEWREVIATGVSSEEKERIVEFIDTFERAIAQKDTDKVLSFFSEPETDEEQKELEFILGSDYARDSAKPFARLFTTAGYNFDLSAHYVRNVSAQGANRRVVIDELRVIPSGGEFVGYSAKVSRLVFELSETSHGYEIERYYHEGIDKDAVKKYEGFTAK